MAWEDLARERREWEETVEAELNPVERSTPLSSPAKDPPNAPSRPGPVSRFSRGASVAISAEATAAAYGSPVLPRPASPSPAQPRPVSPTLPRSASPAGAAPAAAAAPAAGPPPPPRRPDVSGWGEETGGESPLVELYER